MLTNVLKITSVLTEFSQNKIVFQEIFSIYIVSEHCCEIWSLNYYIQAIENAIKSSTKSSQLTNSKFHCNFPSPEADELYHSILSYALRFECAFHVTSLSHSQATFPLKRFTTQKLRQSITITKHKFTENVIATVD